MLRALVLDREGRARPASLNTKGHVVQSRAHQCAWILGRAALTVGHRWRSRRSSLVLLTQEHLTPLPMPWDEIAAPHAEHKAILREQMKITRQGVGQKDRSGLMMAMNVAVIGLTAAVLLGTAALFMPRLMQVMPGFGG